VVQKRGLGSNSLRYRKRRMQTELAWYLDGPWAIVAASGALISESSALRVGDLLCRVTARYPLVALDLTRATHASRPVAAVIRTVHRRARGRGCVFVVIVPDPQARAALRAADRDRELVLCRSGQEFASWRGRPRRMLGAGHALAGQRDPGLVGG
jgi:hypothetical protein